MTDTAEVMQLRQALKTCQEERTYSAEYAVRAEDEASQLREQLRHAKHGLQHLLDHLQSVAPAAEFTSPPAAPGNSCTEVHPLIKELLK